MTAMHAAIIAMAKLTCMAVMLTMMGCAYGDHARHWVGAIQTGMRVQRANADPIAVPMHFRHTVCSEDPLVEASIWLTDLTLDELATGAVADGQALHIELMFRPRPGYTPLDSTATNTSISGKPKPDRRSRLTRCLRNVQKTLTPPHLVHLGSTRPLSQRKS